MFSKELFSLEAFAVGVAEVDPFVFAILLVDALVERNAGVLLEEVFDEGFEESDLAISRNDIRCPAKRVNACV